jgi:hypothetical protein
MKQADFVHSAHFAQRRIHAVTGPLCTFGTGSLALLPALYIQQVVTLAAFGRDFG